MADLRVDDQLLMRTLQPADAHELFTVINNSRQHLRTWLQWVDGTSKEEHSLQFIEDSIQQQHTLQGLVLGIFYEGSLVGTLGMHHWDHTIKKAQMGYWICKEQQGKGIIHRCMRLFIGYLFEQVGLNKIEIHYVPQNKRSGNVAGKLGFKTEGYIRQSFLRNGMLEDIVVAGLLCTEWDADR